MLKKKFSVFIWLVVICLSEFFLAVKCDEQMRTKVNKIFATKCGIKNGAPRCNCLFLFVFCEARQFFAGWRSNLTNQEGSC